MLSIFRFFSLFVDSHSRDKYLEKYIGSDYKKNLDVIGLNVFLIIVGLLCFLSFYFIASSKPPTVFYAWDGKNAVEIKTTSDPIISAEKVQSWTNDALKNIFSFNFYNVDQKMGQNSVYFTSDGWSAFQNALNVSEVLKNVKEKSLEVWLTPTGSAKIIEQYPVGDYYIWSVEVPAIITYRGAAPVQSSKVIISTTIVKVPTTENPNGIEISQIMVHPSN